MESNIKERFYSKVETKLNQGDIFRDVSFILAGNYNTDTNKFDIINVDLKYAIVINQECDLDLDHKSRNDINVKNQDKILPNILLLPGYLSESFKQGNHLGVNIQGNVWSSDLFKQIKENNNPRFHYINKLSDFQVPELVVDFKHIYTIKQDIIYKSFTKWYVATFNELFREDISQRYCAYLSRIGLPVIN